MANESHISSVIVLIKPHYIERFTSTISSISNLEITITDHTQGKVIVVIEAPSTKLTQNYIEMIKECDGVMSVIMVYHHAEETKFLEEQIA